MIHFFREKLQEKRLKATPKRAAIYEAIVTLNNHPTAEKVIEYIKANHPYMAIGTVHKVLYFLVENELFKKSKNRKVNYALRCCFIKPSPFVLCRNG